MLQQIAPWFGYAASLFLIIALLVNGDIKFRVYNLIGCVFFIVYALIFRAWPVLIPNVILAAINIRYLVNNANRREHFELVPVEGNEALIKKFLDFFGDDIKLYFPDFNPDQIEGKINFVVLRDLAIANIFSAALTQNGEANVLINYAIPKYRDFKTGKFIFNSNTEFLSARGVKRLVYRNPSLKVHAYLAKMEFRTEGADWVKDIIF